MGTHRKVEAPRLEPRSVPAAAAVAKATGGSTTAMPGLFYGMGILPGSTGIPVTPYTALQASTVYACVMRLSLDVAKLPVRVHKKLRRGGTSIDYDHPLNRVLRRPNRWQTPSQAWRFYVWSLALRGNGYAPLVRGRGGEPVEFIPMSPDRVSVLQTAEGTVYYQINHPAFPEGRRIDSDNMLHARGMTFDGITGISPIAVAQDGIGLALATQQHGSTLFRQGAQLNGFIKHPGVISREGKSYLTEQFDQKAAGVQNAHKTIVLDENMSFEKVQMTNEDAQFLATRQTQVLEICRYFGVPPHKVFDLSNAHFANIENSEQQYINDTLLPMCREIEEVSERVMLFDDEQDQWQLRFDFDQLLRADRKTRYDTYKVGIDGGFLNKNEARIDDNREPNVPNGDEFTTPLNMTTTANAGAAAGGRPAPAAEPPAASENAAEEEAVP